MRTAVLNPLRPLTDSQTERQTDWYHMHPLVASILWSIHPLPVRQVHKFTCCSASLSMWLQGLLVPPLHSLHQSAERWEGGGGSGKRDSRLEHFSGVPSFIVWSARSWRTTNPNCAREKTTRHRCELCISKVPSSGRAGDCSWPTYSLSYSYFTVGFACGIHTNSDMTFQWKRPSRLTAGFIEHHCVLPMNLTIRVAAST